MSVDRLSVFNNARTLLNSISVDIQKGAFHCVIGESGSGKSLLIRTILNMTSAELSYQGQIDINLANVDAVFQDTTSNMFQNIPLDKHFDMLYQAQSSKLTKSERRVQLIEMMITFGLEEPQRLLKSYPFELSGGMAQRVALMMALISKPQCLVLDEPTSALDQTNSRKVMRYLSKIMKEKQMTMIFITHDLNLVEDYATHISIMKEGHLIENGTAKEILQHPKDDYTKKLIDIAHRRKQYAYNQTTV